MIGEDNLSDWISRLVADAYVRGWSDSRTALVTESITPTAAQVLRYFNAWVAEGPLKL